MSVSLHPNLTDRKTSRAAPQLLSRCGGGGANALFFFCSFWHPSCLRVPFIVAIHRQICVACTILTGGGGCKGICIFLHRIFCRSQLSHTHPLVLKRISSRFSCSVLVSRFSTCGGVGTWVWGGGCATRPPPPPHESARSPTSRRNAKNQNFGCSTD